MLVGGGGFVGSVMDPHHPHLFILELDLIVLGIDLRWILRRPLHRGAVRFLDLNFDDVVRRVAGVLAGMGSDGRVPTDVSGLKDDVLHRSIRVGDALVAGVEMHHDSVHVVREGPAATRRPPTR